jgi:hypothetical protein
MRTIHRKMYDLFIPIIGFVLLFAGSLSGCKKSDKYFEKSNRESDREVIEKFLKVPSNVDVSIKGLAEDLRLKEFKKPFIAKLAKEQGYPLWEKTQIVDVSDKATDDINDRNSSKKFIIPLLKGSRDRVYAAIISDKKNDNYRYKLFKNGSYKSYGDIANSKQVVNFFMYLENKVFGRSHFFLTDNDFLRTDY